MGYKFTIPGRFSCDHCQTTLEWETEYGAQLVNFAWLTENQIGYYCTYFGVNLPAGWVRLADTDLTYCPKCVRQLKMHLKETKLPEVLKDNVLPQENPSSQQIYRQELYERTLAALPGVVEAEQRIEEMKED